MKKLLLLTTILLAFFTLFAEEKKEEIIPKISERRDNYIDTASIYHEETTKYRVDNNDTVRILLDVKNNDLEKIQLVYGDKKAEMSSFGYYKGKEIFSVEVPNEGFSYYFILEDGQTKYYYGQTQGKDELSIESFNYVKSDDFTYMPEWAKSAVGYQIYIDGFRNGNYDNDPIFNEFGTNNFKAPTGSIRSGTLKQNLVTANWNTNLSNREFSVHPWTENYESLDPWEENAANETKTYTRAYGGDLAGIIEKLDYLKGLGVDYILISPPFYSFSNHKYDSIYLNHVDPTFGYLEQTGTNEGMDIKGKVTNTNGARELDLLVYNPQTDKNFLDETTDPKTWTWTNSDIMLAKLAREAHKRDMRVVLEVSPDVTSNKFFANLNPKYNKWYRNKSDLRLDLNNSEAKNYVFNSLKKWILGPDEVFKTYEDDDGIDGIKYSYYRKENKKALTEITKKLKEFKPEILILGEQDRNPEDDIKMGLYDTGIDYNFIDNVIKYVINSNVNYKIDNVEFASRLAEVYKRYSKDKIYGVEVYLDSLGTDRIFSGIINPNRVFDRNNNNSQGYKNIRPDLYDGGAVSKLKMIVTMQMMLPSSPVIYYGDEVGMWGSDFPRNRKPMLWEDLMPYDNESDDISKYQDRLRNMPEQVVVNEVEGKIYYPVAINQEIKSFYEKILKIRQDHKELIRNSEFKILEVYNDPKTKARIDNLTSYYIAEEKRKTATYQKKVVDIKRPNVDFISYEMTNGKESMLIIINNSSDRYMIKALVPKLFGNYKDLMNNKKYFISDRTIEVTLKPYVLMLLYSK